MPSCIKYKNNLSEFNSPFDFLSAIFCILSINSLSKSFASFLASSYIAVICSFLDCVLVPFFSSVLERVVSINIFLGTPQSFTSSFVIKNACQILRFTDGEQYNSSTSSYVISKFSGISFSFLYPLTASAKSYSSLFIISIKFWFVSHIISIISFKFPWLSVSIIPCVPIALPCNSPLEKLPQPLYLKPFSFLISSTDRILEYLSLSSSSTALLSSAKMVSIFTISSTISGYLSTLSPITFFIF